MDAKITLSFDERIIKQAKEYAESQNISLSRLMEIILDKLTSKKYPSLEDFPVSDWVNMVSEGPAEYRKPSKSKKNLKSTYRERKK